MKVFEEMESEVRGYSRSFPTVFTKAKGAELYDEQGKRYIDFFAGAGALNYGHNDSHIKGKLLDYLIHDGVVHALDMATSAKRDFLEKLQQVILEPRGLNYKVQFTGPTGTNAVESALKLARKVTGRHRIVSFTNAFHGMTLGSLSVTGNGFKRAGAGVPLTNVTSMPYDGYMGEGTDTLNLLEASLADAGSGLDKPAAFIVETVQGEGGVNVASKAWLRRLSGIAKQHEIVLVVDDIQVGCGRTGAFFSFEEAGIKPDLICLSKSLSGYGLPMAVLLIRPELDVWAPGEHNGTFRGYNPGFVTATAALDFWKTDTLQREVGRKATMAQERLGALAQRYASHCIDVRGRGLIQGLQLAPGLAGKISAECFQRGLLIETAGVDDNVLKLLPPLTIEPSLLEEGIGIIERSLKAALGLPAQRSRRAPAQWTATA